MDVGFFVTTVIVTLSHTMHVNNNERVMEKIEKSVVKTSACDGTLATK